MLRKDAKIALLEQVPLFSQCSKRELAAIATLTDLIDVPQGMRLVAEGGRDRELMILVEGTAEVKRGGSKVAELTSGDFFGEIALITGGPRVATVTATSPATLLVIREGPFWSLAEQTPSIQTKVTRALAERLRPLTV